MKRAALIVFLVLLIDQTVKIWVKTHMIPGENGAITVISNFFYIHFTENPGMAFGLQIEGTYGKLFLSLFRILAVAGIGWYLWILVKQKAHRGLIFCIALIMAGAMGNIIDSAFYGLIFSESSWSDTTAVLFPDGGGYAGFLHGAVVDMFYFKTHLDRVFWSSEPFDFSFPIFNVSDSAITIGVLIIFFFNKRFFRKEEIPVPPSVSESPAEIASEISESNPPA